MKRSLLLIFVVSGFMLLQYGARAQNKKEKKEGKTPTGLSFGALPTISFDADMGFQYGGLVSVYDYGDGTIYPSYKQMMKVEISRYTKGSGTNQLFYDAKNLLPHHLRLTADLSYLTEKSLDFYGFNGYQSRYNSDLTDKESADYITRVFYRDLRKMFRFTVDLQGQLSGEHLHWLGGFGIMNMKSGELEYANAGHNPPYILKNGKSVERLASTGDIILGCFEDYQYTSKKIRLEPMDGILLYTDGVTEAFNREEKVYGEERLESLLSTLHSLDANRIVNAIVDDVNLFAQDVRQSDDITLLSLNYFG